MENYYLVLELPIEDTVTDPAAIDAALDKKQREWNSSNNTQVKAKVTQYIVSGVIRNAAADPAEWKRVIDEAKSIVDSDLANRLSIVAASLGGGVSKKDIESILNKYKYKKSVDIAYADRLRKKLGIALAGDEKAAPAPKKGKKLTLSDLEPESSVKFSAPAKQLQIIGCADYYDFLRKYSRISGTKGASTAFSPQTDPKRCAAAAAEIEAAWSGKKEDNEKSAVDKVCDQIKRFDSGDAVSSQKNYNRYLVWRSIKDVFSEFWSAMSLVEESRRSIDEKVKADLVAKLTGVCADRNAAEDLLEEYCAEKKVALPKPLPNVGVCPFCENSFAKKGSKMPDTCPVCGRSFMLRCPECGKKVNYAESRECCGFNFDIYPTVEKICSDAERFAETLELDYAESLLGDADKLWKDFPRTAEVRSLIASKKKLIGGLRSELDKAVEENRAYTARECLAAIKKKLPSYSDPAAEIRINAAISEAERLFEQFGKEKQSNERLKLLVKISSLAADFPDLDVHMGSIPVSGVKNVKVTSEQNSCRADIVWESDNEAGTAEYIVMRKAFGRCLGEDDSETAEVARTSGKAFSDSGIEKGTAYYYSVCAVRGSKRSPLAHSGEPAIIYPVLPPPTVNCDETSIQASWQGSFGKMSCEVFRTDDPTEKRYGKGFRVREANVNGFSDSGLKLGEKYYYNIFLTVTSEGRKYVSEPVCVSGVTSKKSCPLAFEARAVDENGGYEIEITDGRERDSAVQFYLSKERVLSRGSTVRLDRLTGMLGLKRISADELTHDVFRITLAKDECGYLYAMNVKNGTAVAGDQTFVENMPTIPVKSMRNDGTSLHIELEHFPKNADMLFVTYSFEGYPKSISDGTKLRINSSNYKRENIVIRSLEQKNYYITGFVRSAGSERAVFRTTYSNGAKTELLYSFSYSLLSGLRLNVRFEEPNELPELVVRYMLGAVPVNEELGSELCTVPADKTPSKTFSVNLSKLTDIKPADNMCAKVFVKSNADKSRFIPLLDAGKSPKLKGK